MKNMEEYNDKIFEDIKYYQQELSGTEFYDCIFKGCDFSETFFRRCRFYNCSFDNCNLSVMRVAECHFSDVTFENSKLIGINWTEGAWSSIKIDFPINFEECILDNSIFFGLNLNKIKIERCMARNVDFREADLSKGNLAFSNLAGSMFHQTNLSEVNLTHTKNYEIDMRHNNIEKAKFTMPEAMSLLYHLDIEIIED
mgnify:CR=1 FL=1